MVACTYYHCIVTDRPCCYCRFFCPIVGVTLFIPLLNNALLKYWNILIHFIGRANSYLLLSVAFLIFLVPIAMILRILKKNRCEAEKTSSKSYYITRDHIYEDIDMKELW